MARRMVLLLVLTGMVALPSATSAHAAGTVGVACVLKGTATFTPPIVKAKHAGSYSFTGEVKKCKNETLTLKSGTVRASGSGTLSCVNGTSTGTATVTWNTGQTSTISFMTVQAGAVVALQGKVTGGLYAGSAATDGVGGGLVFLTDTPQDCTGAGLSSVNFSGVVGAGRALG